MKSWIHFGFLLSVLMLLPMVAADVGTLRVGAAKVDITPARDAALPMSGYAGRKEGFKGIHDHIYARAIVISDGSTEAALVTWELIGVPTRLWEELSPRIAKETGILSEYLLLAGVHDHSAPTPAGMYGDASPKAADYTRFLSDATVDAIRQAKAKLQPAKIGLGTAIAHVNMNRREFSATRGWGLGFNPDGVSDKAVNVIRFDALSGKPIAVFINYPVHAVVMGPENYQISGDIAGATSRYVENYYRGKREEAPRSDAGFAIRLPPEQATDGVVALWTSSAAGDQNPVAMARGSDFTLVDALGQMLGEASVRAVSAVNSTTNGRIFAKQQVITCPGRTLDPTARARGEFKWLEADAVKIRLSLVMINDIALAGVSGEVLTMIHRRLRKESPFRDTLMVTHANGSSGYIPDDAAYEQPTYEITTSRLKPGFAETAIVNGFVEMMKQRR
jgi:neutral ceramidase